MTDFTSSACKIMIFIEECFLFICMLSTGNNSDISEFPSSLSFVLFFRVWGARWPVWGGLYNEVLPALLPAGSSWRSRCWVAGARGCRGNTGVMLEHEENSALPVPRTGSPGTGTTRALKSFLGSVPISTLIVF